MALKIVGSNIRPNTTRSIHHEAHVLSRLDGTVTPRLLAGGRLDGRSFIVTTWHSGVDLYRAATEAHALPADLTEPATCEALVAAAAQRLGGLDVLVNNAATNPYFGATLGVDQARYDKTFQVNLAGPLFWSQAAWDAALKDRPGVIVNIASVGGLRAEGGLGVYNLTKAALIHLTRQLASEIGPTRVVGVAPGLVQTDFAAFLVDNFGERLAGQLPLKRLGDPQDIANLVTFLASDAASWITGETYVIDGGAGVRSAGI